MMTPLQIALIEKLGADNGFEYGISADADAVTLDSARHRARARILLTNHQYLVSFASQSPSLQPELERQYPRDPSGAFLASGEADLARLLHRAAALAQALPRQAADDYDARVAVALRELPATLLGTEVERLVRQLVCQQTTSARPGWTIGVGPVPSRGSRSRKSCAPAMPSPGPTAHPMRNVWMCSMGSCYPPIWMRCSIGF